MTMPRATSSIPPELARITASRYVRRDAQPAPRAALHLVQTRSRIQTNLADPRLMNSAAIERFPYQANQGLT